MISREEAFTIHCDSNRKTEEYCNYTLSHKIRESAIEGFTHITVEVPSGVDLQYAINILKNHGFDAFADKTIIYIRWGEHYYK